MGQRQQFTNEFKAEAVWLLKQSERPGVEVVLVEKKVRHPCFVLNSRWPPFSDVHLI